VKGRFVILSLLMLVLALTRIPGLFPPNFSAVYAIAFCAGVYFRGRGQWLLPMGTLLVSDVLLTLYYQRQSPEFEYFNKTALLYMAGPYLGYLVLFGLGRFLGRKERFWSLLGGGVLGALAFYIVSNTMAWFLNPFHHPEYTKDLKGWIWALTKGTGGFPETWTFFRNTLLSGGLFSALFVGAAKLTEPEPESAHEPEPVPEAPPEAEPEKGAGA
jgi:hypothetical protein